MIKTKRWAWAGAVLAAVVSVSAWAAATGCQANKLGVYQGSLITVLAGGTATVTPTTSACAATFYNGSYINAATGDWSAPTSCINASSPSGRALTADGQEGTALSLPTFQTTSDEYNFTYTSGKIITAGGSIALLTSSAQTQTMGDRTLTLPVSGGVMQVPSSTKTEWGAMSATGGSALHFSATSGTPVHIDSLSLSSCSGAGATFAPGVYYIGTLSVAKGCVIASDGPTVEIHVQNKATIATGACINWQGTCGATPSLATLSTQNPSALWMWLRNGIELDGVVQGSGMLYSAAGAITFAQSGASAWVGEFAGPSVSIANAAGIFYYTDSGAFGSTNLRAGIYALASAAIPYQPTATSLAFFPGQEDLDSNSVKSLRGHFYGRPIQSQAQIGSASWDAATLMTVSQRSAALMTQASDGSLVTVSSAASNLSELPTTPATVLQANSNSANALNALVNPDLNGGAWLYGRASDSLLGRPMRSEPVILGNTGVVAMAAEDGFIYGFDATTGALKWGFYPAENLPAALYPSGLRAKKPWGQLAFYQYGGANYLVATGMRGALHIAFNISSTGALSSVAWKDVQSGAISPPFLTAGDAPTMAVDQTGSAAGKVAYMTGKTLTVRNLADGTGSTTQTVTDLPTSNVLYLNDTALYYGDSAGSVQALFGAVSPGSLGETVAQPIVSVTGAYRTNGGIALLANSRTKAEAFFAGSTSWLVQWQVSATSTTGLPNLPANGKFAAVPTISNARVVFPVTVGTSACSLTAEVLGPLLLETGAPQLTQTTFRLSALPSSTTVLGAGDALTAQPLQLGARAYLEAISGSTNATTSTNWGQYAFSTATQTAANIRLSWRELTNFTAGTSGTSQ